MIDAQLLAYIRESDEPPTHRELQNAFGCGSSVIFEAIQRLRDDNKLLPSDGKKGIKPVGYVSRKGLKAQLEKCQARIKYLECHC